MELTFEWDEIKAEINLKKHHVSFEEGKTVFNDPYLYSFPDDEHSTDEQRYINIGISAKGRVLVLTHTERQDTIRIINCRKATARERDFYEKGCF